MADKRISDLNLHTEFELSDSLPIINNGETKKVTYGSLYYGIRDGVISGSDQISDLGFATISSTHFVGDIVVSGSLLVSGSDTVTSVGKVVVSGSLLVSGSTTQIGNNTLIGNTVLSGSIEISGTTEFGGNIVPKTARGATLGTPERPFSEIFVSSGSINIASDTLGEIGTAISNVDGNLLISAGGMRLVGDASFIATTGSFQYLSGSFTHIGNQFNDGDIVMIGNNTMTGNTQLTGSVNISGSLNVNTHPVVLGQLSWARYDDTQYTTSSVFSLTTVLGQQTLPNNSGNKIETHLHSTLSFYDSGSKKIQVENEGDVYMCTVAFKAKTGNAQNAYFRLELTNTVGTPYDRVGKDLFFPKGNNVWHDYHEVFQYYADTDFVTNGNEWSVQSYGETIDIANVIYFIQRTQNHLI